MEDDSRKGRFTALVLPLLSDGFILARSITGNRADAEDVVQDACLRAFRAINTVVESSARAWFLTIVHHTACTWLRRNRPAALLKVDDLDAVGAKPAQEIETPESTLIGKMDRTRLEAAIASLSLGLREAITLREIEGLNYREIAQVTGVPIGTVMSRIARARSRLIELIGIRA
jgi:RNA polymerase sigma factor (sigma-70 family)